MNIKDPTSSSLIPRPQTALLGPPAEQIEARTIPSSAPPPAADRFDARPGDVHLDHRRGTELVASGTSSGVVLSPQLREKLAPYLKDRPKKGFGYIVAEGDVLDQLLEEAYQDGERGRGDGEDPIDKWLEAFLLYNRHLGLDGPEALDQAIGQLLFFPELAELLDTHEKLIPLANPLNFPAIEAFLRLAALPPEAAAYFHFVQGRPNAAPNLMLRADNNAEARRGLGKRTKRWKTENVPNSMSRMARTAGSTVLSLVEEARNLRAAKAPADGTPATEES